MDRRIDHVVMLAVGERDGLGLIGGQPRGGSQTPSSRSGVALYIA
jgi:hypothetical protein